MRAQVLDAPSIPRNRMPVPIEQAQQARQRIEPVPEPRPSRRSRRRGGVQGGVGVVGGEGLAEAIGQIGGEVVGERLYGESDLDRVYAENEAELRRRMADRARLEEQLTGAEPPDPFRAQRLPGGVSSVEAEQFGRGSPIRRQMPRRRVATGQQSQNVTPKRWQRALGRLARMTGNPYARAGVIGLSILGANRRASPSGSPALASSLAPEPTPIAPAPLTRFEASPVSYFGGFGLTPPGGSASQRCDCKPKRRKPARRCLERAPVRWAGGRYKGKSAGTRCVRWE